MAETDVNTDAAANAKVMMDLVVDPQTTTHLSVNILNKLLESYEHPNFFVTMFEENMTLGECPECGHQNHWLIPEDDLNQMGYVSHDKDSRVPRHTDAKCCPKYQEACSKKKVSP
jgi:hypothetical protein